jgi:septal ring factor EnvC (AmiA/AmiB activator)
MAGYMWRSKVIFSVFFCFSGMGKAFEATPTCPLSYRDHMHEQGILKWGKATRESYERIEKLWYAKKKEHDSLKKSPALFLKQYAPIIERLAFMKNMIKRREDRLKALEQELAKLDKQLCVINRKWRARVDRALKRHSVSDLSDQ